MAATTPVIKLDRCKGCELCVVYCPKNILLLRKELNALGYHPVVLSDPESCSGCGNCALMCPDIAITFKGVPDNEQTVDEG